MSRIRLLILVAGIAVPALFGALIIDAKYFTEGWGALGLGAVVLPLGVASGAVALVGGVFYVARIRTKMRDVPLVAVVTVNALLLWLATSH
jgi:hypothetical protein